MILERKIIELTEAQSRILKTGWGNSAINETILEKITYDSDGLKVKGYVAYPKIINEKLPCIIWCRGGFGNTSKLDDFYAKGILGQIASWGYFVFESQYRGNDGGEGIDEFGGNDLNDVLNLIPIANEFEFADKNIWGIEGWSRGGMMTYLTLTKNYNFKAAISVAGISNVECSIRESRFMKKIIESHQNLIDDEFCESRTILNKMENFSKSTPTLLIHGLKDERVPVHHSIDLSNEMIKLNIEHRLILLENGDHFLKSHKQEVDKFRKNWFKKYLINEEK
ncbi:MAG: S9 family peptidase [Ignavibacteriae bacterium]|nr:S9 family peptidase [Ignavibacteriota bacterium]